MKKTVLKTIYKIGAFAPFHWANRNNVLILTYHRFSREKDPSRVSEREFGEHLEYLKNHHRVLPLAETIDYLRQGKTVPPNTTVITIDDGYADAYDIGFPVLKKFGIPATVYGVTDFLDGKRWLWTDLMRYVLLNTREDVIRAEFGATDVVEAVLKDDLKRSETANRINTRLKKLPNEEKEAKIREIANDLQVRLPELPAAGFAPLTWANAREMEVENVRIESHTASHPILTNIGQAELDLEMQMSKKRLEEVLERRVEHFCYPNGSLDKRVRDAAQNAGYVSAVTTAYGFNDARIDRLLMNRIDALSAIESFAQSASGFEAARQKMFAIGSA